jgi:hypothetical protein
MTLSCGRIRENLDFVITPPKSDDFGYDETPRLPRCGYTVTREASCPI